MIYIDHLSAGYDGRVIIHDVNEHIARGEFLGVIGPNGGGKTTLIKSLLGLLNPLAGSITYRDREGRPVRRVATGYLPQRKDIDTLFPITVEEVVLSGLMSRLGWFRRPTAAQRRRLDEVLEMVGLSGFREATIGALSGGQIQRAMVGRAIIRRPELLVLDEPNSYLDMAFEEQLYQILKELNRAGTTIVMVSHEMASLSLLVSRVVSVEGTLRPGTLQCPYHHHTVAHKYPPTV
jgi:zinc transport system ATP-binding protein